MNRKIKHCTKCGKDKLLTDFYKDTAKKDGLRNECKVCKNKADKIYREKNQKVLKKIIKQGDLFS